LSKTSREKDSIQHMKLSFLNYTGHGQCSHKSQNHKASQIAADNKLSTTAFGITYTPCLQICVRRANDRH